MIFYDKILKRLDIPAIKLARELNLSKQAFSYRVKRSKKLSLEDYLKVCKFALKRGVSAKELKSILLSDLTAEQKKILNDLFKS